LEVELSASPLAAVRTVTGAKQMEMATEPTVTVATGFLAMD
jgi:hypothetical protein